jgi:hypothetical protein
MKNSFSLLIVLVGSLFYYSCIGQNMTSPENENAIILSDSNNILITGKKAGFIYFMIGRDVKVKIINSKGKDQYSKILFPESLDPSYIYHNADVRNPNNCFSRLKIERCFGTIIKPNGKTENAIISQTTNSVTSVGMNNYFVHYDQPQININNLAVGDILSLHYSYDVPYNDNYEKLTTFRVFFNGPDYKDNYNLHLSCDDELNLKLKYYNDANPDTMITKEQAANFYWKRTKLTGSIDEIGSKPYLELPYIQVTIKPSTLIYELPNSFEQRYIPLYAFAASLKEQEILNIVRAINQGVKNKSYIAIDNFVAENTKDITKDSLGYVKLVTIHNQIVDNFKYDNDTTYFNRDDPRMERIGEYVASQTIREISRYTMYAALISKLDLSFYTAYIADTRVGMISDDFVGPMFDNDFLFGVVLKNNTVQLIYPKKSKFGYYTDEVPFYFENTTARLVCLDDYQDYKKPINESFRKLHTPYSSFDDNDRKSNILVNADLDKLTTTFTAKIVLRGQYSTLTRGLYQYGYIDKSINGMYAKRIFEIRPDVKLLENETHVIQKVFPFKTEVKLKYSSDSIIKKTGDNKYSLNLMNWFMHVCNNLNSETRITNYYPDFKGKDTYSYIITFNKNIELLNQIENINIENNFGNFVISFSQNQPNTLIISSFFLTKTDKVTPDKFSDVTSIFTKIQELNRQKIEFKIVD